MKDYYPLLSNYVSRETFDKLVEFKELLDKWNDKINLIRYKNIDELIERHFVNSILLGAYIEDDAKIICDLGSGGGFPGIIVGLICKNKEIHLIESDSRKSAFLIEAGKLCYDNKIIVHNDRVEDIALIKSDIIICRAFAPLDKIFEQAQNLIYNCKYCLFLKGEKVEDEIAIAEKKWHFEYETLTVNSTKILKIKGGAHLWARK